MTQFPKAQKPGSRSAAAVCVIALLLTLAGPTDALEPADVILSGIIVNGATPSMVLAGSDLDDGSFEALPGAGFDSLSRIPLAAVSSSDGSLKLLLGNLLAFPTGTWEVVDYAPATGQTQPLIAGTGIFSVALFHEEPGGTFLILFHDGETAVLQRLDPFLQTITQLWSGTLEVGGAAFSGGNVFVAANDWSANDGNGAVLILRIDPESGQQLAIAGSDVHPDIPAPTAGCANPSSSRAACGAPTAECPSPPPMNLLAYPGSVAVIGSGILVADDDACGDANVVIHVDQVSGVQSPFFDGEAIQFIAGGQGRLTVHESGGLYRRLARMDLITGSLSSSLFLPEPTNVPGHGGVNALQPLVVYQASMLIDTDGDGVADADDNCPLIPNGSQTDTSPDDQIGDACQAIVHSLVITDPIAADRSSVGSGATVLLSVGAKDSLGHVLHYTWSDDCPSFDQGIFSNDDTPLPTWTAPQNHSGASLECTLSVTIQDALGQEVSDSLTLQVTSMQEPPAHTLTISSGPVASPPGPLPSGGATQLSVTALDSVGHTLEFTWESSCPVPLLGGGFQPVDSPTSTWTAPVNPTQTTVVCTIEARVEDGFLPPASKSIDLGIEPSSGAPEASPLPFFLPLADIGGGISRSRALGISADGSTVVGWGSKQFFFLEDVRQAVKWVIDRVEGSSVLIPLPDLADTGAICEASQAHAANVDGTVVVGTGCINLSTSLDLHAARWVGTSVESLGDVPGGIESAGAFAVSADGSVVAATGHSALTVLTPITAAPFEAFLASASASGMTRLFGAASKPQASTASSISADANVVAGGAAVSDPDPLRDFFFAPAWWIAGEGWEFLPTLPGAPQIAGYNVGFVNALTPDGTTAAGGIFASVAEAGGGRTRLTTEAFVYSHGDAAPTSLGQIGPCEPSTDDLFEYCGSIAYGVSATGRIVVGASESLGPPDPAGNRAWIWRENDGMRSLKEYAQTELEINLNGWTLNDARAISADGQMIAGFATNPSGHEEAFVLFIPEASATSSAGAALMTLGGLAVARRSFTRA